MGRPPAAEVPSVLGWTAGKGMRQQLGRQTPTAALPWPGRGRSREPVQAPAPSAERRRPRGKPRSIGRPPRRRLGRGSRDVVRLDHDPGGCAGRHALINDLRATDQDVAPLVGRPQRPRLRQRPSAHPAPQRQAARLRPRDPSTRPMNPTSTSSSTPPSRTRPPPRSSPFSPAGTPAT